MYMTLATADTTGRPWVSPVWFATDSDETFLWVSAPETRHSRNIAARPEVAIVIFDSTVPVGRAEALYVEAVAEELAGDALEHAIAVYSRRSQACGARGWNAGDVLPPARFRLYRATASAQFVLGPNDQRLPVRLEA
jgi:Pyridoxamine 5'-phosphate oxidase